MSVPRLEPVRSEARARLEGLVRAHEPMLLAFARRLCEGQDEARDLVQDTFERALRNLHRFEDGTNARAWLCTILHNTFVDRCRSAERRSATEPIDELPLAAEEPAPEPSWAQLDVAHLHAAIARLDPEFQRVYRMHALEQRPYDEIARELGIAYNTVGTRLTRARTKLRTILSTMLPKAEP